MVILTYNEGKSIISDIYGPKAIYKDVDYDGSDGLAERIDIYTILKVGFFGLLTDSENYPQVQDRFELITKVSDFLCSNKNRWDGPKLGTDNTINLTQNQVKDTRYKIQNNSYYFGKTHAFLPLSFLDSKRDFVQMFLEYDTNLLYKLSTKTGVAEVSAELLHASIEDWLCVDNDLRLGKEDRILKHVHKNFIQMNSDFIYKCLENKQSVIDEIEYYNFVPSVYKVDTDIFWKVIDPYMTRPHMNFDIFQTLIQLGSTMLHAETRDFFVKKHVLLSVEKFGAIGVCVAYISLSINWVMKVYGIMYSFYYTALSQMLGA